MSSDQDCKYMLQAIAPAFRDIVAAVGIIDRLPEPRPEAAKPDAAWSHRERWRLPAISRGAAAACLLVVLAMPCLTPAAARTRRSIAPVSASVRTPLSKTGRPCCFLSDLCGIALPRVATFRDLRRWTHSFRSKAFNRACSKCAIFWSRDRR